MKVAVVGLWHLGSVIAASLAKMGHDVIAYDPDAPIIQRLQEGKAPLFEPGLNALIHEGVSQAHLIFTNDPHDLKLAELIWVTFDTPVDEHDVADVDFTYQQIEAIFPFVQSNALVLISSQLPVGSTRKLLSLNDKVNKNKNIHFAYSPENLRLGKAIQVFTHPDRIVVGLEHEADKDRIQALLGALTNHFVWMSIESAEMTKHALNAFLAASIVFINDLAQLCEHVGADALEVEQGLKTEERIGPKAYLHPGSAIAGGTLARDVNYLVQIAEQKQLQTPIFRALLKSNEDHKQWSMQRLAHVLKNLQNKTIAALGLTYKAGTNTLRRSGAIELCHWLKEQGARINAYDPAIAVLPAHLAQYINVKTNIESALQDVDAVVIATEWPQFSAISADQLLANVKSPIVFDANGFLRKMLGHDQRIQYYSVGHST